MVAVIVSAIIAVSDSGQDRQGMDDLPYLAVFCQFEGFGNVRLHVYVEMFRMVDDVSRIL